MVGGRGYWKVHVTELGIAARHRPDVGIAHPVPRFVTPRVVTEFALLRHSLKDPQLFTSACIKSAYVTKW